MKYRLIPLLFTFISIFVLCNRSTWKEYSIISWDASGYYMFLPSVFIYHDLGQLGKTDSVRYHYALDIPNYGLYSYPNTGRRVEKYPLGVAIMEMPFFFAAHYLICPATHYSADGFSIPYQITMSLCTIFWASLGLFFLGMILRRYYNDATVIITLVILAFGTNFYCNSVFIQGLSHPFSFFLFACLLYYTDNWKRGRQYSIAAVGFLLGMLIITRPTNMIAILIPLLWPGQANGEETRGGVYKIIPLSVGFILFCTVCLIQMSYWKYTTGQWICYSYSNEGFTFLHPHFFEGLFGFRKGWFVYTPIGFIIVCSIPLLWKNNRRLMFLCTLLFVVYTYVIFCWWMWFYPGGFSSRPMVDILPLLSLPLAALISTLRSKKIIFKTIFYVFISLSIALNLFQTYQYSLGIIRDANMNKAYYWRVFGKIKVTDADRKLLLIQQE